MKNVSIHYGGHDDGGPVMTRPRSPVLRLSPVAGQVSHAGIFRGSFVGNKCRRATGDGNPKRRRMRRRSEKLRGTADTGDDFL